MLDKSFMIIFCPECTKETMKIALLFVLLNNIEVETRQICNTGFLFFLDIGNICTWAKRDR